MKQIPILVYSLLLLLLVSCGTQEKIVVSTKTIHDTVYITNINPQKYHVITEANLPEFVISKNNFPSEAFDQRIKFLVLHYTVSDYPTSVKILTKKNVSAHYLVTDQPNDSIDLLVSEDKRAWHAGYSYWNGRESLNDTSIGIEIVNKGYTKVNDSMVFTSFPDYQIKKVAVLAKNIIDRYEIDPVNVIGHSDIAPLRKQDPGPAFPWKYLYTYYNIGAWYEEADKQYFINEYNTDVMKYDNAQDFQKALQKYGYKVDITGTWDKNTTDVIRAFQWHFRPEKADGIVDAETWAILQALIKKYKK